VGRQRSRARPARLIAILAGTCDIVQNFLWTYELDFGKPRIDACSRRRGQRRFLCSGGIYGDEEKSFLE
jgi:hypothetical protein